MTFNFKLTKRHWTIMIFIILAILLYFLLPVSIPLILAFITALFLNPLIRFFQRRLKIDRKYAVGIVFLIFIISLSFIGTLIVTRAIGQVVNFVEAIPNHFRQINELYMKIESDFRVYAQNLPPEFIKQVSESIVDNFEAFSTTVKEKFTIDNIAQVFAKIPQYLISFIVYLIALFFIMLEMPALKEGFFSLLTEKTAQKVTFMNERLSIVFLGFIKAQFLVSIVIFITSFIGLLFITPDMALLMSLIIWVIDLIPIIGSIIILGPWAIYMFLVGKVATGVKLSILAIILLIIRRTVEPKFMGSYIGLSPLATLIAMFLGLKLIGFLGLFIGPLVVIMITSAKEAGIIHWNFKF